MKKSITLAALGLVLGLCGSVSSNSLMAQEATEATAASIVIQEETEVIQEATETANVAGSVVQEAEEVPQEAAQEAADYQPSPSDSVVEEEPALPAEIETESPTPDEVEELEPSSVDFTDNSGVLVSDENVIQGGIVSDGIIGDCVGCSSPAMFAPPMMMDASCGAPAPIYDSAAFDTCGGCDTCAPACPTSTCGVSTSSCNACGTCGSSACGGCQSYRPGSLRERLNRPCPGKCGCKGGGLKARIKHWWSADRCRR